MEVIDQTIPTQGPMKRLQIFFIEVIRHFRPINYAKRGVQLN